MTDSSRSCVGRGPPITRLGGLIRERRPSLVSSLGFGIDEPLHVLALEALHFGFHLGRARDPRVEGLGVAHHLRPPATAFPAGSWGCGSAVSSSLRRSCRFGGRRRLGRSCSWRRRDWRGPGHSQSRHVRKLAVVSALVAGSPCPVDDKSQVSPEMIWRADANPRQYEKSRDNDGGRPTSKPSYTAPGYDFAGGTTSLRQRRS
jgi:hypothetical protein